MKTLGVFLGTPDPSEYLKKDSYYYVAYQELDNEIARTGAKMVLLSSQDTYLGGSRFSKGWVFDHHQLNLISSIECDVVFDKGRFISDDDVTIFNPKYIHEVCTDKWLTYTLFPELSPLTFRISDEKELHTQLLNIPSDLVICKPIDGGEGKGVKVLSQTQVLSEKFRYPFLMQEFLDTSIGIPGIIPGMHDLRIAILNGEIVYSFVRTPPEGKMIANVAQGGELHFIAPDRLPDSALKIVTQIDSLMSTCPERYYGIDLAYTPQGPKIIEMNSRLGMTQNDEGPEYAVFTQKLAKTLLNFAKDHSATV